MRHCPDREGTRVSFSLCVNEEATSWDDAGQFRAAKPYEACARK